MSARTAERRTCGCPAWKTKAPRMLGRSFRAGWLILYLICETCERRYRRIVCN